MCSTGPDRLMPMETPRIEAFTGQYRFLSNFYIEPDGTHVEGEYQAQKSSPPNFDLCRMFPGDAKRAGRKAALRPDWEQAKIKVMKLLVLTKFLDHPGLAARLRATGEAELVEGNYWGDTFWGRCNGVGENWLGRILMEVRHVLSQA